MCETGGGNRKSPVGREIPNSRHNAEIRSAPLVARITNCIRWSSTAILFHGIVFGPPGRKLYPRCKECPGTHCKGCCGTIHFRPVLFLLGRGGSPRSFHA